MMDLTKIDQPFVTLDIETKLALHRAHYEGKVIEGKIHIIDPDRWIVTNTPEWLAQVTYRLRPEPLRDISLPWAALDDRWKWAARDESGSVWIYDERPHLSQRVWTTDSSCLEVTDLFANFDPGNKPGNESLISRHEVV